MDNALSQTLRLGTFALLGSLQLGSLGCRDTPRTDPANATPHANAGPDQSFPLTTEQVVTLDGRRSNDEDGSITRYRWLSGTVTVVDAGIQRAEFDLPNSATPSITLGPGVWTFTLWVEDNEGAISDPDTVVITIGEPQAP